MDSHCRGWDSVTASTGTPKNFLGDLDTGYFTLVPTPDADDVMWLTVVRYPLVQLTSALLESIAGDSFQIPF